MRMIERPQWYAFRYRQPSRGLIAGQSALYQEITTDTDAPFRMTGVAVYVFVEERDTQGSAGNVGVTLRWTMPDGTWVQKHIDSAQLINPFDNQAVNGAGGMTAPYYSYFAPLGKNIFYPTASSIVIDFAELAGITDALVMVVFLGTKLYGEGSAWWPLRDPTKPARPYIGYSTQFDASKLPILNLIFSIAPDADFAWEASAQTSQGGGTQAHGDTLGPGGLE